MRNSLRSLLSLGLFTPFRRLLLLAMTRRLLAVWLPLPKWHDVIHLSFY